MICGGAGDGGPELGHDGLATHVTGSSASKRAASRLITISRSSETMSG